MTNSLKELTIQSINTLSSSDLKALLDELFDINEVKNQISNNADLKADNIFGSTIYEYFKLHLDKFNNLLIIEQINIIKGDYTSLVNRLIYNYYNTIKQIQLTDEGLSKFTMNYNMNRCDQENKYLTDPSCKSFKNFIENNAPLWVAQSPSGVPLTLSSIGDAILKDCNTPWGSLGYWDQCKDHTAGIVYIILFAIILFCILGAIIWFRKRIAPKIQ